MKIIKSSEKNVRDGCDCSGEIFLKNPQLKVAELHVKDFFADDIDRLATIDLRIVPSTDHSSKVGKLGKALPNPNKADNSIQKVPSPNMCRKIP